MAISCKKSDGSHFPRDRKWNLRRQPKAADEPVHPNPNVAANETFRHLREVSNTAAKVASERRREEQRLLGAIQSASKALPQSTVQNEVDQILKHIDSAFTSAQSAWKEGDHARAHRHLKSAWTVIGKLPDEIISAEGKAAIADLVKGTDLKEKGPLPTDEDVAPGGLMATAFQWALADAIGELPDIEPLMRVLVFALELPDEIVSAEKKAAIEDWVKGEDLEVIKKSPIVVQRFAPKRSRLDAWVDDELSRLIAESSPLSHREVRRQKRAIKEVHGYLDLAAKAQEAQREALAELQPAIAQSIESLAKGIESCAPAKEALEKITRMLGGAEECIPEELERELQAFVEAVRNDPDLTRRIKKAAGRVVGVSRKLSSHPAHQEAATEYLELMRREGVLRGLLLLQTSSFALNNGLLLMLHLLMKTHVGLTPEFLGALFSSMAAGSGFVVLDWMCNNPAVKLLEPLGPVKTEFVRSFMGIGSFGLADLMWLQAFPASTQVGLGFVMASFGLLAGRICGEKKPTPGRKIIRGAIPTVTLGGAAGVGGWAVENGLDVSSPQLWMGSGLLGVAALVNAFGRYLPNQGKKTKPIKERTAIGDAAVLGAKSMGPIALQLSCSLTGLAMIAQQPNLSIFTADAMAAGLGALAALPIHHYKDQKLGPEEATETGFALLSALLTLVR